MIKTVKVKKKMRLDELIKYIYEKKLISKEFNANGESPMNVKVKVNKIGEVTSYGYAAEDRLFTVEVEEEITEDTVFNTLVDVNNNDEVHIAWNDSISLYDKEQTKEMHAVINGKLELIWEAE